MLWDCQSGRKYIFHVNSCRPISYISILVPPVLVPWRKQGKGNRNNSASKDTKCNKSQIYGVKKKKKILPSVYWGYLFLEMLPCVCTHMANPHQVCWHTCLNCVCKGFTEKVPVFINISSSLNVNPKKRSSDTRPTKGDLQLVFNGDRRVKKTKRIRFLEARN